MSAAPFEALLAALSRDIHFIEARMPGSSDLETLRRFRDDLVRALMEARVVNVWLAPKEIADRTGKGLSTVTKECREFGKAVGATRNGKRAWRIHWPIYESWMTERGEK